MNQSQPFSNLTALFINTTIKKDAGDSHTLRLIKKAQAIMEAEGVAVETIHMLDYQVAFGMEKDLTEHGWDHDDWPAIQAKIMAADILVIGSPIWLGQKSSLATLAVERMYAYSADTNDKGQYCYYGKVAGCLITGNEDGVKHCSMDVLYSMSHIGYTIPPQADAGWLGEIGPGPSYGDLDEDTHKPIGYDNDFTNRNTTYMAWNLMHMAKLLKDNDGLPAQGNTDDWQKVTHAQP